MQLSQRTSAKGNAYLAGWLGKASVVAFQAEEPDKWGNPVWDVFVSTPEPRSEAGQGRDPAPRPQARAERRPPKPDPGGPPAKPAAPPRGRPGGRRRGRNGGPKARTLATPRLTRLRGP